MVPTQAIIFSRSRYLLAPLPLSQINVLFRYHRRWSPVCFNIVMVLCPSLKVPICSLIPPERHYFAFPQSRDCTGMMRRFRVAKIGWLDGLDVRRLLRMVRL